jgi:hypothetical protein
MIRLLPRDAGIITGVLALIATGRGLEYGTQTHRLTASLSLVERAAPMAVWSALFFIGAALLVASYRWARCGWLGHTILAVAYTALLVGVALAGIGADGSPRFTTSALLLPLVVHALFALRSRAGADA